VRKRSLLRTDESEFKKDKFYVLLPETLKVIQKIQATVEIHCGKMPTGEIQT
jgi:hypothetical protein